MGDPDRAGLLARDRDGLRPRTTSSLRAEKKPCFFSIFGFLKVVIPPAPVFPRHEKVERRVGFCGIRGNGLGGVSRENEEG